VNIVLLGDAALRLNCLQISSNRIFHAVEPSQLDDIFNKHSVDFLVSYGYRFIVPRIILDSVNGSAVNLHIGYLPYNRGAHPNLWANLENTPSGVTIHKMTTGIDKGSILLQEKVHIDNESTFKESYGDLSKSIERLFELHCQKIANDYLPVFKQEGIGNYHRIIDLKSAESVLKFGWNTVIKEAKLDYLKLLKSRGYSELGCVHEY